MIARVLEWWRRTRRRDHWHNHTDGDYLDLRPRLQIGRRHWW